MIFEIGKCYVHASGKKMRIIGEMDTYYYGHCLIGETDDIKYLPIGQTEENVVNWAECEDFANEIERDNAIRFAKGSGCDWDGDLITVNGKTYYVDESRNLVREVKKENDN